MKIVSRAGAVAAAATALVALVAPAAGASPTPEYSRADLKVCVYGLGWGDEARVKIDGDHYFRTTWIRGCETFRVPKGWYDVSVHAPHGYDVRGQDERSVNVYYHAKVWFTMADEDHGDDWSAGENHGSGHEGRFVRVHSWESCPRGYVRSEVNDEICVRA